MTVWGQKLSPPFQSDSCALGKRTPSTSIHSGTENSALAFFTLVFPPFCIQSPKSSCLSWSFTKDHWGTWNPKLILAFSASTVWFTQSRLPV